MKTFKKIMMWVGIVFAAIIIIGLLLPSSTPEEQRAAALQDSLQLVQERQQDSLNAIAQQRAWYNNDIAHFVRHQIEDDVENHVKYPETLDVTDTKYSRRDSIHYQFRISFTAENKYSMTVRNIIYYDLTYQGGNPAHAKNWHIDKFNIE